MTQFTFKIKQSSKRESLETDDSHYRTFVTCYQTQTQIAKYMIPKAWISEDPYFLYRFDITEVWTLLDP